MKLVKEIYKNAVALDTCDRFTGKEDFNAIVELLLSKQGIEFCTKNNFPDLDYFEQFDQKKAEAKGIYINSGLVEISNHEKVLLVGDTQGVLKYDTVEKSHTVILMHCATANITAENYAVVFVVGDKDDMVINVSSNAIVQ